jgi:excisionase family DNA binding protein
MESDAQLIAAVELTVSAAARTLAISPDTVYRLIHGGHLPFRQVGLPSSRRPTYRLLADDVLDLLQRYERQHQSPAVPSRRKTTKRVTSGDLEFIRLT